MPASGARTIAAAALASVLAGGCATGDPQGGGFVGGVVGLASGQYERGLRERDLRLAGLRAEGWRLGTEERILAAEREALTVATAVREREADALARRTLQLDEEIRGVRRALARTEARRAELEAEAREPDLERLAEEAAALREELAELERAAAEEAARRAQIRAEIERLKEDLGRPYPSAEAFGN